MLYNHDLIKKLRIGAFAVAAVLGGYSVLTYLDQNIHVLRLVFIFIFLIVSVVSAYLLKKPSKLEFIAYTASTLLIVPLLMFRLRQNLGLDLSLMALIIGIIVSFGLQLRKSNGFA